MRWLKVVEQVLIGLGVLLLVGVIGARSWGVLRARTEVQRFEEIQRALAVTVPPPPVSTQQETELPGELPVDTGLWAAKRITAYEESLSQDAGRTLALLKIPTIDLQVPVLEGTDDLVLNRGVGRIAGTAAVDAAGNIGIAGHRDGFFRGLKDVATGDPIELVTARGSRSFVIDELLIVDPQDVYVLDPTEMPTITLVTCYPFYYLGSAPRRYIVRAVEQP